MDATRFDGGSDTAPKTETRSGDRMAADRPVAGWSPGDVVRGEVVQADGMGRFRIRIGSATLSAIVHFPVGVGETISAVVGDIGPPLQLKAFGAQPGPADRSPDTTAGHRQWLADIFKQTIAVISQQIESSGAGLKSGQLTDPVGVSLYRVWCAIQPLGVGPSADGFLNRLTALIINSGLYFEKKLAVQLAPFIDPSLPSNCLRPDGVSQLAALCRHDLKPHLLRLMRQPGGNLAPAAGRENRLFGVLKTAVHLLLADIGQQHRRLSHQRADPESAPYYQHLLYINDHEQQALLRVYCSRETPRKDDDGFRISLWLNLRTLGDVRVDLSVHQDVLQIRFFVGDDALKQRFDRHLGSLLRRLDGCFAEVNCRVSVSASKIEDFHQVDVGRPTNGSVDVRI